MTVRSISEDYFATHKTSKPVPVGSAVNVIYFTNKCNLACTYCYEDLAKRPPQVLSREDIRKHVDAIIDRESPDSQTMIVLFGGEPTLEWDNVCYLMEYAYSKKKFVHFNMTTNGIKYLSQKFIDETKSNYFYQNGFLSIDVSFDGVGNKNRIFHNGEESTRSMLEVFKKLNENRVRYRIRYTIHNLNINRAYEDIKRIMHTFRPYRLITSIAWSTLSPANLKTLENLKNRFREDWINKNISTPVCDFFCDMCNGCSERKELKSYFTDEGNVVTYKNAESVPEFDHFKDKEI